MRKGKPIDPSRAPWIVAATALALLPACSGEGGGQNDSLRVVANAISFPEGPVYIEGELFFVAYGSHQVLIYNGEGVREFWREEGCGPSAVTRMDDGDFFVTCYDSNTIAHLDAQGRTVEAIDHDSAGGSFVGSNDLAKDENGGLYFTASGVSEDLARVEGKVLYRAADGAVRLVADKIHNANGLVVTDGGATLLVAEHLEAQVLRYTIAADGSLSDRQVWKRLPDLVPTPADAGPTYGCDGIKRDAKGNIYIANNGGGRLLITDPEGELLHTVEVPYKAVSNVGLGPDVPAERTGGEAGDAESFLYISAVKDESDTSYPGAIFKAPNPER